MKNHLKSGVHAAVLGASLTLILVGCTVEPATPVHETVVNPPNKTIVNPPAENKTTIVNPPAENKTTIVNPPSSGAPSGGG